MRYLINNKNDTRAANQHKSHLGLERFLLLAGLLSMTILVACGGSDTSKSDVGSKNTDTQNDQASKPTYNLDKIDAASSAIWVTALDSIQNSLQAATQFEKTVIELLNNPNNNTLQAARLEWQNTYNATQTAQPFLYLHHKDSAVLNALDNWRFMILAWPIQPGYIDSYQQYTHSGIVNDLTLTLTKASLRKQHRLTDSEEVILGLHGIEYILWGEKGERTAKDFVKANALTSSFKKAKLALSDLPNNRRRQLIKLQSQLLLNDLQTLKKQWQAGHLLSLAYFQLSPTQRLSTINNSINQYLKLWSQRLKNESVEVKTQISINDFSQEHLIGFKRGINSINDIYFSNEPALAEQLFEKKALENIQKQFSEIKTSLKEGGDPGNLHYAILSKKIELLIKALLTQTRI